MSEWHECIGKTFLLLMGIFSGGKLVLHEADSFISAARRV